MNEELDQFVEELDDSRTTIVVEGDGWGAVCHPDISGEGAISSYSNIPYNFRVFGDAPDTEVVSSYIEEKFGELITDVSERIERADNPVEEAINIGGPTVRSTIEDL